MDRRRFLTLAGSGLLMAAAPAVALVEPRRRFWQVSRDAPVPGELFGIDASSYPQWNGADLGGRPLTWEDVKAAVDQLNRDYPGVALAGTL